MKKLILQGKDARKSLASGSKQLSDAVGATYGPISGNVIVHKRLIPPRVLHDGLLISEDIELSDPFENAGVQIIKEAAKKTCDGAGDGTTASIVFADALVQEGFKAIDRGEKRMKIRQQMLEDKKILLDELKKRTIPIKDSDIEKIATISAQDSEIGKIVSEAITRVGKDGVIHVEDSYGNSITTEFTEGLEFQKGYMTQAFLTDEGSDKITIENPLIFITDHHITDHEEMISIVSKAQLRGKNLLLIADSIEGAALQTLIYNIAQGEINAVAVFAPGYSNLKSQFLSDIALVTGSYFVSKHNDHKVDMIDKEYFGMADKVIVTPEKTLIVGGKGDKKLIEKRLEDVRLQLKTSTEDYRKEQLRERIAKIIGGIAIIKVGAPTEVAAGELKARVDDAVLATRAALEEGIVPGGATMLLRLSNLLGSGITKDALITPFKRLLTNAGLDFTTLYQEMQKAEENEGIDTTDGTLKNLITAGIIDPVKVTRLTIENSISVAGEVITTDVIIVDKPEEK